MPKSKQKGRASPARPFLHIPNKKALCLPLPGALLSCFAKKVGKEATKGSPRAPARDAVPLKNPPGPPIAGTSVAAFGGSGATLEKKTYLKLRKSIPAPSAMRPGGGLGERGRDCGSKTYNALPQPTSLVTFLFGTRK